MTFPFDPRRPIQEAQPHIYTGRPTGPEPVVPPQIVAVHEQPPSKLFVFRFAPGVGGAIQITSADWPCRKVVFFAPGPGSIAPNALSIFGGVQGVSIAGPTSFEVPPGGNGVIEIVNLNLLWWIGQNATDVITGWAESNL